MTKAALMDIARRHSMDILRDPITQQAWGLGLTCDIEIPELDAIVDDDRDQVVVGTRSYNYDGTITYRITVPTIWMDLWGWAD